MNTKISRENGFVLMATSFCIVALLGMLGLATDLGRMYVVRNEAQAYVDSAALSAALQLDGTSSGIGRARAAVAASSNLWNMSTQSFEGATVQFASSQNGPWDDNPASAASLRFVRVAANADVPVYFITVVASGSTRAVGAQAVAGQVPKTDLREGAFPFSPMAHDTVGPDFGLQPGELYTLRWAASPKLNKGNVCSGDNSEQIIDHANATGSERGYIEENSASVIRQAVEGGYQTRPLSVGDTVDMTGGAKSTIAAAISNRINQDTDPYSSTYEQYASRGAGNGRRLVVVPINTWSPDYTILGFGAFFLLTDNNYSHSGNQPWCGEYLGPYVEGSSYKGAGEGGAYMVRLVR